MMTNGPAATIGGIVEVGLPRPRDRWRWRPTRATSSAAGRVLEFLYSRRRGKRREDGKAEAGGGRQRHGRREGDRRAPQAHARPLRHHHLRAEPHPNYNRILLSPVLAGEQTIADIVLNDLDWYRDNGIRLLTGAQGDEG
jgi:hypothetical protein